MVDNNMIVGFIILLSDVRVGEKEYRRRQTTIIKEGQ